MMALKTVSQPLPEMEHLPVTKQLICGFLFFFFLCILSCYEMFSGWGQTSNSGVWNYNKSQSRLSRLGLPVMCIGLWGCRTCLPMECSLFLARGMKPKWGNTSFSPFPLLWQPYFVLSVYQAVSPCDIQDLNTTVSTPLFICLTLISCSW